jgi:hypothetical protein
VLLILVAVTVRTAHGWITTTPTTSCYHPSRSSSTKCGKTMMVMAAESSSSSSSSSNVLGIESTPNPSSFLIQLSTPLKGLEDIVGTLKGKTFSTASMSSAAAAAPPPPLEIANILQIDGIESVFALATALTINKHASAKWESILPLVMNALGATNNDEQLLLQGLLLSSSADSSSSLSSSSSGQARMRMQLSNKIPIQIEATGFLGTTKRVKLPPVFQEYMQSLIEQDDTIDFFGGRKWIDRGVRYLIEEEETDNDVSTIVLPPTDEDKEQQELDSVLQSELEEVSAAYSKERLAAIAQESSSSSGGSLGKAETATATTTTSELDLESVDRFCDLAEQGNVEALVTLSKFVSSHKGSMAARRNALAYLGGTAGDGNGDVVFDAVVSALQNEKNPIMRRTAGDALSDLGDSRALPYAVAALSDKSKLVQWRAARILGELGDSIDIVAVLKQASFSDSYAFEVAFEIKDAMRKVKSRMQAKNNGGGDAPKSGPMWKQIQEGTGIVGSK